MATTTAASVTPEVANVTGAEPALPISSAPLPRRRVLEPEQRVVLRGIDWEGFETILKVIGDQGATRLAYDCGEIELMSPSNDHEWLKKRLARLIESLTVVLDIPCEAAGSPTWKKALEAKGLEPDECYYFANSGRVAGRHKIDLNIDPPPDVAIEVEISRSALDRLGIYAALGVSEVWRFGGETLVVEGLQPDGIYGAQSTSPSLPFLPLDRLVDWIYEADGVSQTTWIRRFQKWVLEEFGPRNA